MVQVRPPGIYEEQTEQRFTPLRLSASGVPAFMGLTRKGPTSRPVRIRSQARFFEVFGRLRHATYLEDAVRGFFENGGRECFVMRTAHLGLGGGGTVARRAMARLRDGRDEGAILVEALNEGSWGNEVRITTTRSEPRLRTFITLDLQAGDLQARLRSTHGLEVGTIVRIFDGDHESYRTITALDDKTIGWHEEVPLEQGFASGGPTYVEPVEFDLVAATSDLRERFTNLSLTKFSPNYFVRVVAARSRLITVTDLETSCAPPENLPLAVSEVALSGGEDGLAHVTPDDFIGLNLGPGQRFGLSALDEIDEIDLVCAPDLPWCLANSSGFSATKDVEVVQRAMIEHCEARRDRFAILDFPDPGDHVAAQRWRLTFDSAFAAFYFPWVVVRSATGRRRSVPPCGHVAGSYARSDQNHGVFRAPANDELEGVVDLELILRDEDIGEMNHRGINCLKSFTARGIRVWGARTACSDGTWRYINVRRTLNTIIRSMNTNLQWVVFEPNSRILWKIVARNVSFFLAELWELGFFKGSTPNEAFYVKCDDETNPPEIRDAGQVVVEVGVAPVRPAEFIIFRVQQNMPETDSPGEI